jgi:hypothetical protein
MWHVCGKKEMHTEFRWGNLKERHRPVDYARTRLKKNGKAETGMIWLRIGTNEGIMK